MQSLCAVAAWQCDHSSGEVVQDEDPSGCVGYCVETMPARPWMSNQDGAWLFSANGSIYSSKINVWEANNYKISRTLQKSTCFGHCRASNFTTPTPNLLGGFLHFSAKHAHCPQESRKPKKACLEVSKQPRIKDDMINVHFCATGGLPVYPAYS